MKKTWNNVSSVLKKKKSKMKPKTHTKRSKMLLMNLNKYEFSNPTTLWNKKLSLYFQMNSDLLFLLEHAETLEDRFQIDLRKWGWGKWDTIIPRFSSNPPASPSSSVPGAQHNLKPMFQSADNFIKRLNFSSMATTPSFDLLRLSVFGSAG